MNTPTNDDEIVGIFVEEAEEVFDTIDDRLATWRELPTDRNAIADIRRCFHTLKGSGRMVNALDLGEVAWKVENMLNRVIRGSIQVTEPLVTLVSKARNTMPRMLEAFANSRPMGSDNEIETLMAQADALAAGQKPAPIRRTPAVVAASPGSKQIPSMELTEFQRKLERLQHRSDEALHRSEMALGQARRAATQIKETEGEIRNRVGRNEMNPIIERINLLAREVLELRRESKRTHPEQPTDLRDVNQIVDQRIRERMEPSDHQHNEFKRELDEALGEAAAARNSARVALVISALVAAGAVAALLMSELATL